MGTSSRWHRDPRLYQFFSPPLSTPTQPVDNPPPIHEWRSAPSEGEHVRTPRSTDRHTHPAFTAPPPPSPALTRPIPRTLQAAEKYRSMDLEMHKYCADFALYKQAAKTERARLAEWHTRPTPAGDSFCFRVVACNMRSATSPPSPNSKFDLGAGWEAGTPSLRPCRLCFGCVVCLSARRHSPSHRWSLFAVGELFQGVVVVGRRRTWRRTCYGMGWSLARTQPPHCVPPVGRGG